MGLVAELLALAFPPACAACGDRPHDGIGATLRAVNARCDHGRDASERHGREV
jgi:hypothetical protein